MLPFNNLPAPNLRPPPRQIRALPQIERASAAWLDRLCASYGVPRALLVRQLGTMHALEYEIARAVADAAWGAARRLLDERERPDDKDDLFSRAVAGCYKQLRDAEIRRSAGIIRGTMQ